MDKFYFDFENLKVYQMALAFIGEVFKLISKLPYEFRLSIGDNFIRAAISITNNLAEGNDKESVKDRKRFFQYASDSARECVSILVVLNQQRIVEENLFWSLKFNLRQITSMLRALKGK